MGMSDTLSFCWWHECHGCGSRAPALAREGAAALLRDARRDPWTMRELRERVFTANVGVGLSLVDDEQVVVQAADLIARAQLHICRHRRSDFHGAPQVTAAEAGLLRAALKDLPTPAPERDPAPSARGARPAVARRPETHWVQFNVVDKLGQRIGGLPYRLRMPGGDDVQGTLPLSGKLREDGVVQGTYTLELGELRSAAWEAAGSPVGGPLPVTTALTLVAHGRHLPPGTVGKFKVFRLFDEEPGRAIGTASGTAGADGRIQADFVYELRDDDHGREVALIFSCTVGKWWIKSPPLTLRLPRLVAPRWHAQALAVGEAAMLAVDCPGIADGEKVHFRLCRADTGATVAELDAAVQGETASVDWQTVDPDPDAPATELRFDASCQGLMARSRPLRVVDTVELVFQDEQGAALAQARVTLVFQDGSRRQFETDAAGTLTLTDARARTARVIVAGADEADVVELTP